MVNLLEWSRFAAELGQGTPLSDTNGFVQELSASFYCRPHFHQALEIVYHPVGRGLSRLGPDQEIKFQDQAAVIYAPRETHDQTMLTDGLDLCVHLQLPETIKPPPPGGLHIRKIEDVLLIAELTFLSRRAPWKDPLSQQVANLRATAALLSLVGLACADDERQKASPAERRIFAAEHYLRENATTIKSMREVAEHVGISYDYLRHSFRMSRGRSMVRYLNEVRIERAKAMLLHAALPLKEIAPACGFRDEYYLSTVFRKLTGLTPGDYRRRAL